jgi:hypothetical protein
MPAARLTDPQTSHEAAASVKNITATQSAILDLLRFPMNDEELVNAYYDRVNRGWAPNASPSGIRSRRAELADRGLVVDSLMRARLVSGRQAIVWTVA